MSNVTQISCNFCGKGRSQVDKLIVGNEAGICNECLDLCANILDKERMDKLRKDKKFEKILDPVKIKEHLDQFVIGQDQAKITLAVGVVNHFKRILLNPKIELEKSNILMFGPSGSGKTLLARTVAKFLNIPFVIADATTLTEAGYVGEDVESVISRLFSEAEYDVERCEQGIVFIDEIDKISRKSESATLTRDVSGEGVQQALLKLIEGTKCKVSSGNNKKHPNLEQIEINTEKILFIAGGAFTELDDIIAKRQNKKGIGFGASVDIGKLDRSATEPDDFLKYGMIPEFTGRFPVVTYTNNLSKSDLIDILIKPKNSLILQMQFYFEADDIELVFEQAAVDAIAEQAYNMQTGARGLKNILEKLLNPYMYVLPTLKAQGIEKIEINERTVKYNEPAIFKEKNK
jgi:ATP-dependent Clp protease ATP-binding subunit ClpX